MSDVWSSVEIKMPTKNDYICVEILIKELFDDKEHWSVEEYDEQNLRIQIEEVRAVQDDVVEFAKVLSEQLVILASHDKDNKAKNMIESTAFTMCGHTEDYNSGEEIDYEIERKDKNLFIKETENYWFTFNYDYEDFCDFPVCFDMKEAVPEDKYDPDGEYYITYNKVYKDEEPEFCEPYPIERFRQLGVIHFGSDEDVEALFGRDYLDAMKERIQDE